MESFWALASDPLSPPDAVHLAKDLGIEYDTPEHLELERGHCVRLLHMLPSVIDRWSISHYAFLWWSCLSLCHHLPLCRCTVAATCHSVVPYLFLIAHTRNAKAYF